MNNETARADPTHRQVVSAGWWRKSLEPLWFYILVLGTRCTDHMCNSQIYKTDDKSLRILEDCMLNCMQKNDRKNPCWQYPTLFLIAWDLSPLGGALRKALMTHKDRNATGLWSPTRLQYPVDLSTVRVCECEAEERFRDSREGRKVEVPRAWPLFKSVPILRANFTMWGTLLRRGGWLRLRYFFGPC